MNTTNSALIIFTRNPELGKCKTRLAKTIGDEAALRIYIFLVEHTDKIARSLPDADLRVYFSDFIGEDNHYWHSNLFSKHLQHGEDLGVRMERAFTETFNAGYVKVVIIGSDLYDLGVSDLAAAFDALESHEAVLGPASDGGYYLLGLKKVIPSLFAGKAWGTSTVLETTLEDLAKTPTYILAKKNDIDRYEDITGNPVFESLIP